MQDSDSGDRPQIFFFHGLESGPHGSKYDALSERFQVTSPDFRELDILERLARARALTADMTDMFVVGSSFGGLLAALLFDRFPERFAGYLLMAPALHHPEGKSILRAPAPGRGVIIHGTNDEVVPIEASRTFAEQHGIELIEVDDDHRLKSSTELMCDQVKRLLDV